MKLVTVIPFIKTLQKETLTYFSGKEVKIGDIVVVPVRNKDVEGLVINTEDVSVQKGDVKDASFNLRKIKEVKGSSFFKNTFINSCQEVRSYFVASTGQILDTLIPAIVFENYSSLNKVEVVKEKTKNILPEKYAFQAPIEDRLVIYKTYIRESFAKKESVFFCFPTIAEAEYFYDTLKRGVEDYSILLHTGLSKKDFVKRYNESTNEEHPIIIFGTPSFLFIPRNDLRTIIMERESSGSYRSQRKPYLDARIFAEMLSYKENLRIIFADSILRTETMWRTKTSELEEFQPLNWRLPEKEEEEIIDMREDKDKDFQIISKKVFKKIKSSNEKGERMLLFTLRKGYATTTICNDCGTTLTKDGEPLILFEDANKKRFFKAVKSKKIYDSNILCGNCGGWNLNPLGIGTEKVYEEVLKILPEDKVFVLDKTKATTEKKAKEIIHNFENTPGSVLIGTEVSLFYLTEEIENVAIISFDSLFNIPNYNIYEKIIDLVVLLNSYTKKSILLQTRYADEKLVKDLQNRNLIQFYKDDIVNRKNYKYPPFYNLIKVSYDASAKEKGDVIEYLKKTYEEYMPSINDVYIGQNKTRINMVIKVPREEWSKEAFFVEAKQNKDLLEKLSALPPYWSIHINPEQLS